MSTNTRVELVADKTAAGFSGLAPYQLLVWTPISDAAADVIDPEVVPDSQTRLKLENLTPKILAIQAEVSGILRSVAEVSPAGMPPLQERTLLQVLKAFLESGATLQDLKSIVGEVALMDVGTTDQWNADMNRRRADLLKKDVEGTLSADESFELAALTRRLRNYNHAEETRQVNAARSVYQDLLKKASSASQ